MRTILGTTGLLVTALLLPLLLVSALLGESTSATAGALPIGDLVAPVPYAGSSSICTAADPTGGRCLTPATRHAYDEVLRAFGPLGTSIASAGCWDEHAWNPTSDHPRGRACDYFPGRAGEFPQGQELQNGWRLASWLRAHAAALRVSYIIWQGRIWSPGSPDSGGWGRAYAGGGVYDPSDVTGGHFDHIHLSIST